MTPERLKEIREGVVCPPEPIDSCHECVALRELLSHTDALQSEFAELRRKLRQEYGGMLDEQEALRGEVARLKEELNATKLARGQPEHYTVELVGARAENAMLREALDIALQFDGVCGCEPGGITGPEFICKFHEALQQSPVPSKLGEES